VPSQCGRCAFLPAVFPRFRGFCLSRPSGMLRHLTATHAFLRAAFLTCSHASPPAPGLLQVLVSPHIGCSVTAEPASFDSRTCSRAIFEKTRFHGIAMPRCRGVEGAFNGGVRAKASHPAGDGPTSVSIPAGVLHHRPDYIRFEVNVGQGRQDGRAGGGTASRKHCSTDRVSDGKFNSI